MGVLQLLAKENYITYHKTLARVVGVDEAILFGELCSMSNLYGDEFFCEQSKLINDTCLTEYRLRNALKNLQKENLVSVEKKGLPAKNWYILNEDRLLELLDGQSTSGTKFDTTCDSDFNAACGGNYDSNSNGEFNSTFNKNTGSKNTGSKNTPKKKESKKDAPASFDALIDKYSNGNEEVKELLGEWLKVRKAKRAAMTDRAIELNLEKLDKLAGESNLSVTEYLKEIICRGWQAFYPINNFDKKAKSAPASNVPRYSNFDARAALERAVARSYGEKEPPKTAAEDESIRERAEALRKQFAR